MTHVNYTSLAAGTFADAVLCGAVRSVARRFPVIKLVNAGSVGRTVRSRPFRSSTRAEPPVRSRRTVLLNSLAPAASFRPRLTTEDRTVPPTTTNPIHVNRRR